MRKFILFLIVLMLLAFSNVLQAGDIPRKMNYQGYVQEDGSAYTGTGYFLFAITDSAGTTYHWTNDGDQPPDSGVSVTVTDGVFSVLLGDTSLTNMTTIGTSVFTGNSSAYLRVWFSTDGTTYEEITPKKEIASGAYAYNAYSAYTVESGVTGPSSSTDNAVVRWDGTGGGTVQSSSATITDGGVLTTTELIVTDRLGIDDASPFNTTLGYQALYAKTSGANNIAIGYKAGDNITSGDSNIIIGNNQDAEAPTTDNYLNVGGTLYGDLNNDRIGVGTYPAAHILQVEGDNANAYAGHFYNSGNAENRYGLAVQCGLDNNSGTNVMIQWKDGDGDNIGQIASSSGSFTYEVNASMGYAGRFFNDGNNADRYGIAVQCGTYDNSGTNTMIQWMDGNGTDIGQVTSSSGTVTYGAFTANHDAAIPADRNSKGYEYGTIMCLKKVTQDIETSHQPKYYAAPSSKQYEDNIFGVYCSKYQDKDNLHTIYALGDGHVLVTSENGDVKAGDYITSSSSPGLGMKATRPGAVLGLALESWNADRSKEILELADGKKVKKGIVAVSYYPGTYYTGGDNVFSMGENGKLSVKDKDGNLTQLSSHDEGTGKWIFYSKNTETGRVLRIEMEELIFDLAEKMSKETGKKYISEYIE